VKHREIRASQTPGTLTVYQAYSPHIAERAIAAGRFVPPFKRERMTWIKPFLPVDGLPLRVGACARVAEALRARHVRGRRRLERGQARVAGPDPVGYALSPELAAHIGASS
jgi:hypothetical protein